MQEIPTLSLKTVQFNPTVFTPTQYEYKAADMSILERSLAQRETRMKEAAQGKNAIDRTLAELELKLNPAEAKWFEGYKQDIRNQIQSSIDSGDYGAAVRDATTLAGSVMQDPRILGRIRSQEAYDTELKTQQARRNNGEISQNTYDWWVANNKYSYTDNTDANGNYIEGSPWKAESTPVKDINWAEQAATAFKLITPKKNTSSKGGGSNITNADGTGKGSKWSSSSGIEQITVEDILGNIEELLSSTPDGYRQAEQDYNVKMFDYKRLEQQWKNAVASGSADADKLAAQLKERQQLMYKNGAPIGYKEYYARMVINNHYADTLAYKWATSGKENFSSKDNYAPGSGGGGAVNLNSQVPFNGYGAYPPVRPYIDWYGPSVRWGGTYDFNTLNGAIYGIGRRFNGRR